MTYLRMPITHVQRERWLRAQIGKCHELMANDDLSKDNHALVVLLCKQFNEDLQVLRTENSHAECC